MSGSNKTLSEELAAKGGAPRSIKDDKDVVLRWKNCSIELTRARLRRPACFVNQQLLTVSKIDNSTPVAPLYAFWAANNCTIDGHYRDAARLYESALATHERVERFSDLIYLDDAIRLKMTHSLFLGGDSDAAIREAEAMFNDGIAGARYGYRAGRYAEQSGKKEEALRLYDQAARLETELDDRFIELAERSVERLLDTSTIRFNTDKSAADAVLTAIRARDAVQIERLLSSTHFAVSAMCCHQGFEDSLIREAFIRELLSWRRLHSEPLEGVGEKRFLTIGPYMGRLLRDQVHLRFQRFIDGWQWTGISLSAPSEFWRDRWSPTELKTNQPLPFAIKAPWPAGQELVAGGLKGYLQKVIAIGAITLWPPWLQTALQAAMALGFSLRKCGFGIRGFYYNHGPTHNGVDAFAIDFSQYARGQPYRSTAGGIPVLACREGIVVAVEDTNETGTAGEPNEVEIVHQDVDSSGTQYRSRYLHMEGPDAIPVDCGSFVLMGQRLGLMNDTGLSAIDHLHFSMHNDGVPSASTVPMCGSADARGDSVRPTPMDGQTLNDSDDGRCISSSNIDFGGPVTVSENSTNIVSQNMIRIPAPDAGANHELFVFTGIGVFGSLIGEGSQWVTGSAAISANYASELNLPANHAVRVHQSTVKIDLASIANQNQAINTGWAVETFDLPTVFDVNGDPFILTEGLLRVVAGIAIRDVDASILRLSYNVSVVGEVAPFQINPIL